MSVNGQLDHSRPSLIAKWESARGESDSPRSLFLWLTFKNVCRITADLLTQCCVLNTLKYTKYVCGIQPCPVSKSLAELLASYFFKRACWRIFSRNAAQAASRNTQSIPSSLNFGLCQNLSLSDQQSPSARMPEIFPLQCFLGMRV